MSEPRDVCTTRRSPRPMYECPRGPSTLTPAYILYPSGSTAKPKAILHTTAAN